jgi:midasin (ATPase involved in ribosome maturation)
MESTGKEVVLDYLQNISKAIDVLARPLLSTSDVSSNLDASSADYYLDHIARSLLYHVCDPSNLSQPVPEECFLQEESQNENEITTVIKNRIDVLRNIFRVMPCIALDVAARVSSIVLSEKEISIQMAANTFVLFGLWLPIAPQLAQFVSDLFQVKSFTSPLKYIDIFEHDTDVSMDMESGIKRIECKDIAIFSEAVYHLIKFYSERGDHDSMKRWWEWTSIFTLLGIQENESMEVDESVENDISQPTGWALRPYKYSSAIRWFCVRAISYLMNLTPTSRGIYIANMGLDEEMVPWVPHPWTIIDEETKAQNNQLKGVIALVRERNNIVISTPTPLQIREHASLPSTLVHLGNGLLLPRKVTAVQSGKRENRQIQPSSERQALVMTNTMLRNLSLLGTAMASEPYPPPILVCGPRGSGKSSLIRELAHYCSLTSETTAEDDLLELHVDEETDSKTLLGSYAATDIPGEFTWRPGALTNAVRSGKWVLLEDVESCPAEIQAALIKLLEDRVIPLGIGKSEKCHPNFRLFGTCTTNIDSNASRDSNRRLRMTAATAGSGGKRILHPGLWRKVHVDPLPYSEIQQVSKELFPNIPEMVSEAALNVLRILDNSGRVDINDGNGNTDHERRVPILGRGRHSSVRDLVKVLRRISCAIHFEPGVSFCTESQKILCMAETYDIFAGWCPCRNMRNEFVTSYLAPIWGISATTALRYIEDRQPQIKFADGYIEVGRAVVQFPSRRSGLQEKDSQFADTNYALRLMESTAVCIAQNEPTLLVGETGCGKTTLIQRLASISGHKLIVQNLSLQTDSTDLLGGYRPLEIRHIARSVYTSFVQLFVASFSKSQNEQFLDFVTASYEKGQWKKLSQCFQRASTMGLAKMKQMDKDNDISMRQGVTHREWSEFKQMSDRFERQRIACETGLAFVFTEGALVDAIRTGKWVLLDEINLASSETLERLCGLLDDSRSSLTLTEKGDSEALKRHPDFRIFAAMNPATDAGKKDLPSSLRSRFSEIYVDELIDPIELRQVAAKYLRGIVAASDLPLEHTENVITSVEVYLRCRFLSEQTLVDGSGQRPRYTLRTLCRALSAARNLIIQQKLSIKRALLEGFELGFEGSLDSTSKETLRKLFSSTLGKDLSRKELDHPGKRPGGKACGENEYELCKPFWLKTGPLEKIDWSDPNSHSNRSRFVLTPSMEVNLRRLSRAVAAGPWPILLEGPTSAGKTTMIEYLAARCGHRCVRINNHEHTDVQEYTGSYASDSDGKLCFQEGILVQALRQGHWVILDELNLAPSEVLEALNRLLDDNRELYLSEINEVVRPHPNFKLFATQNPSGAYGGRKPLSRAFRNRFVEMHMGDIPEQEMITILEKRCNCPPSYAKLLVKVMTSLQKRRSKSGVFRGKDGLITPRDLLRWAERKVNSKQELALQGYMLLAERLRDEEEKMMVKIVLEEQMKVEISPDEIYYGQNCESRRKLSAIAQLDQYTRNTGLSLQAIAPTKSLLRLLSLVEQCVEQQEPVLLVGDTGCGKTTVVQLLSVIYDRDLQIVNCHASTETSDLLGGLRPTRGRKNILRSLVDKATKLAECIKDVEDFKEVDFSSFLFDELSHNIQEKVVDEISLFINRIKSIIKKLPNSLDRMKKKRKLENGKTEELSTPLMDYDDFDLNLRDIESYLSQYFSLFEWVDGPLVRSMKKGDLFLLDEMSLADDAVLERLNSVLEPSRTLVLAERGGDLSVEDSRGNTVIEAHENFRIFATMNPGGDFGKRELSPALRSRFTEIWVPSVTDAFDIDLVLGQTLNTSFAKHQVQHLSQDILNTLKKSMLNYVKWFNVQICGKPMSQYSDFVLSLRDVLSWARFVVETIYNDQKFNIWSAYAHGASLMHLDGLGLGTGLSQSDAHNTRDECKAFLSEQIPSTESCIKGFHDEFDFLDENSLYGDDHFGIEPFVIPKGELTVSSSLDFKLDAPTTGMNLRRVLRAMQVKKPILLEGSPGVGKTSLISALAKASGHTLVRINLSEQTDISDLMGGDLPIPEKNEDGAVSNDSSFRWCDGALLKAIKNGHWVLLDELNLASQTVLEGLNSCLDHRACVYIPELGKTFACPPTFRIFAAQNPLAQGGGRKGLPKSFLNRFTKVYVETLTKNDLYSIVSSKFPVLNKETVQNIINFNTFVQDDIDSRRYGQQGSPWEFNLRDVFRWCELISNYHARTGVIDVGAFADTIYIQRLRCHTDRQLLSDRYEYCFGYKCTRSTPRVTYAHESISFGLASLKRHTKTLDAPNFAFLGEEPNLFRSLLSPLEAVSLCVELSWPCLLLGSAASGKSTILKLLAESCNRRLVDIALTPSSDVSELIGSFEQIDAAEVQSRLLGSLTGIKNAAWLNLAHTTEGISLLKEISAKYHALLDHIESLRNSLNVPVVINENSSLEIVQAILKLSRDASKISKTFSQSIQRCIQNAEQDLKSFHVQKTNKESNGIHFRWFDGALVEALENGYWIHLENVNLCSASVLDRLNPLLESGGELNLTECGIEDDNGPSRGSSRVVQPHPDFRIFLSMNPIFGEVSRAMRNRCIEVSLLPSNNIQTSNNDNSDASSDPTLDSLDCLWASGVRSASLAQYLIRSHIQEFSNNSFLDEMELPRKMKEWSLLSVNSLNRGVCGTDSVKVPTLLAYEIHHDEYNVDFHSGCLEVNHSVIEKLSSRRMLDSSIGFSRVLRAARILRFTTRATHMPLGVCKDSTDKQMVTKICLHLIGNYMKKTIDDVEAYSSSILDGYSTDLSSELRYLSRILTSNKDTGSSNLIFESRLHYILEQHKAFKCLDNVETLHEDNLNDYSPIQISYCIHENKFDRSLLLCPVTSMLYPFFEILDSYIFWSGNYISRCQDEVHAVKISEAVRSLLCSRDRFWRFLNTSTIRIDSSVLAFDDSGFFVHWNWLKKKLNFLSLSVQEKGIDMPKSKRDLDLLIQSIDKAVNNETGISVSLSSYFWKNTGIPLVPANSRDSMSVQALYDLATQYTVMNEQDFGFLKILSGNSANISLQTLFDRKHGSLIFNDNLKMETLIALAMAHWATTDEAAGLIRSNTKDYDVAQVVDMLQRKLSEGNQKLLHDISSCIIDSKISNEENKLDSFALEKMREENLTASDKSDFSRKLLGLFSNFQLSPIVEFICVQEEERLVDSLMKFLRFAKDDGTLEEIQTNLLPRIKSFISSVISLSLWNVSDLRPYQTIVWSIESSSMDVQSLKHLLGCLHTTLLSTLQRHYWCNSFNDTNSLSDSLAVPAFWNSERFSVKDEFENHHSMSTHLSFCAGKPRIFQNFISDYIFRLQGFERKSREQAINKVPYRTLENDSCRCNQTQKLIELLSERFSETNDDTSSLEITFFLLERTAIALRRSFTSQAAFNSFHDALVSGDVDCLITSMAYCVHSNLNSMTGTVLAPLAISVNKMISDPNPISISEAQVYLGLLRFHLLIPASPLDPGKKPAAKVLQWQNFLEDIRSELLALQMEERLETGRFQADGDYATKLLEDISYTKRKQDSQRKKQVERPKCADSFYELFRDVHHFANTIGSVKTVTCLIEEMSECREGVQHKENNWQSSATAFSTQLHSKYKYYEDVVTPILSSMGLLQQGIRMILNIKAKQLNRSTRVAMELQDELLRYPNVRFSSKITEECLVHVSKAFDMIPFSEEEKSSGEKYKKDCQLSLLLSSLSSLCMNRVNGALNDDMTFSSISRILKLISDAWYSSHSVNKQVEDDETEEERQERHLREQFPDYAKEFQKTITAIETIEQGGDFEEDDIDNISGLDTSFHLSDDHVAFLCDIHSEIFNRNTSTNFDVLRLRSFLATYTAAAQLNNALKASNSILTEAERVSAHTFALAVNVKKDTNISFQTFLQPSYNVINFHRDANPEEILKANDPLEGLLIRVSQLLNAFPGNSILLSIGQIADNMRKMDVQKTSVGKMLVGLEVILRRAQDWEQHSSERVSLGENLARLSRLVAQWRKLELQSWNSLLDVRDKMNIKRAKQHFMRLYSIIVHDHASKASQSTSEHGAIDLSSSSPLWVWKGFSSKAKASLSPSDLDLGNDQDFTDKLRLLDTFILTSGIGQFIHRLNLVESLANQVQEECQRFGYPCKYRYAQSVILKSFVEHYKQFEQTIRNVIQRIRDPFETKLKNEVKLAKWDEQTYYSLSESAEKSHKKLMMLIREYETGLATTVTSVLEEKFLNGIRSGSDVGLAQSPITKIPSNISMFPDLSVEKRNKIFTANENPIHDSLQDLRCKTSSWALIDDPFLKSENYLNGMPKYYKKMTKIFSNYPSEFIAKIGCDKVNDLCEAIFERLDILRKKGTKPMKHRALVDLFKTLKENGYSSMKWSVPSEIRDISRLFLLRGPNSSKLSGQSISCAKDAESYFHKCIVEISRLRSEVDLVGSEYMSKREMDLMIGFSDYGLLMLSQQRSMLFKTIEDLSDAFSSMHIIDQCQGELPSDQTRLCESLCAFNKEYSWLLETLRQTLVMIKSLATRTDQLGGLSCDIIAKLQSIVSLLTECYTPNQPLPLVSFSVMKQLQETQKNIEKSSVEIKSISRCIRDTNIFPKEMLKPCKEEFTKSLDAIAKCLAFNHGKGKKADSHAFAQISDIVKSCLLSAQILNSKRLLQPQSNVDENMEPQSNANENEAKQRVLDSIGNIHNESILLWNEINLSKLSNQLQVLIQHMRSYDASADVVSLTVDASKIVLQILDQCQQILMENLKFYRSLSKLEYIKLRLFRVLIAKGFCSDDVEDGGDAEGDAGDGKMNFEDDVEGTGMGEGDGKEDVTDQIENEEQLLGLKGDEEKEKEKDTDKKQLDEEEAETGMEMENDFDGDMFDVPDKKEDDEKDQDDDGQEELDREMGDGSDPNEQVVDEKMWDEDDEEDGQGQEEEKFEKDSKMEGETIQDELRTKEDDEGDRKGDEKNDAKDDDKNEKPTADNALEESNPEDQNHNDGDDDEELVNNDFEDNYEDKNVGVDVRNEDDGNADDDNDNEESMELEDDLNLEEGADDEADFESNKYDEDNEAMEDENDSEELDQNGNEINDAEEGRDDEPDNNESEDENLESSAQAAGDGQTNEEKEENDEENNEDEISNEDANFTKSERDEEAHGFAATSGYDKVKRQDQDEGNEDDGEGEQDEQSGKGEGEKDEHRAGAGESDATSGSIQDGNEGSGSKTSSNSIDAPNPFRDPGDAEKFWHKKLNVISEDQNQDEESPSNEKPENDQNSPNPQGDFEFTSKDQDNSTQVLSGVNEEDATGLNEDQNEQPNETNPEESIDTDMQDVANDETEFTKRNMQSHQKKSDVDIESKDEKQYDEDGESDSDHEPTDTNSAVDEDELDKNVENDVVSSAKDIEVVTDLSQLQVRDKPEENFQSEQMIEEEVYADATHQSIEEAREKWSQISAETNSLSRRLCEKLRLVMEPLVASKLRGDYRTGKRINMKRVIGFIASGYRKDKIWLRRTKPGKRDYRILLAVDDSESMRNGAGDMALAALTTLANGMSQLEIGELRIASFGEEMKLIHPFHAPFTSSSGVDLINSFKFSDKRTRTALCVESALAALESQSNSSSSMQLVFIISDGRIERDSRERLRRIVREMTEKNILLVMLVVEGDDKGNMNQKDSIINMKEVSFENGKPKVKHFIDDYPFPYYMVLQDMHSLPEVLGDALKQWFEMMAMNQGMS